MPLPPKFNTATTVRVFEDQLFIKVENGFRLKRYIKDNIGIFAKTGASSPLLARLVPANAWLLAPPTAAALSIAARVIFACAASGGEDTTKGFVRTKCKNGTCTILQEALRMEGFIFIGDAGGYESEEDLDLENADGADA